MATLNIKNVPDALYRKLQARARRERRSVAQEVIHLLSSAVEHPTSVSIRELRGLGKDAWRAHDASVHVKVERDTWDWTAARLRATTGVKTPDALQLAAARVTRCTAYLTNDRALPEVPGLRVLQRRDYA
jgi:predicted nucleic acid-binding protein